MKFLIIPAAAVAALAIAPALAQTAAPQVHKVEMKGPMTRASVAQKVQEHFARIDADRNGVITKAEAEAARAAMREKWTERRAERREGMFERLDTDNDGSISKSEFESAHASKAGHGGHGRHIRMRFAGMDGKMFEMADANNDGQVTLAEATAAATAHFDKMDADRDGTLTRDEMRSGFKKRMKPAT